MPSSGALSVAGDRATPAPAEVMLRWATHWNEAGEPTQPAGMLTRYRPLTPSKLPMALGQGISASPGTNTTTWPKPLPRFNWTMKSGEEFPWLWIAQRT
jgi:hypothetical protein